MNEDRALLLASADRLFQDLSRAAGTGQKQSLPGWADLEEAGFNSLLVPENLGGAGASFQDAGVVLERAGWYAIDLPLAEAMLSQGLLGQAGIAPPGGMVTFAAEYTGTFAAEALSYSGVVLNVPWGLRADHILVSIPSDEAAAFALLPRSSARSGSAGTNIAGEARDRLEFDAAPAQRIPAKQSSAELLFRLGALARVAQISGTLERIVLLSVEHAGSRRQFGKALSDFQVIQHQLALLAEEAAAVKCAAQAACRAVDLGGGDFEVAAAKSRANQAVGVATAIAHQVHGAIGCTQEHVLQRLTRRLWAWRSEFGNDRHWADWLGRRVCGAGVERFWPDLTALGDRGAD